MLVHSERRGRVVPTHYPPAPSEVAVLHVEALRLGEGREYFPHCHARMHLRRIKLMLVLKERCATFSIYTVMRGQLHKYSRMSSVHCYARPFFFYYSI